MKQEAARHQLGSGCVARTGGLRNERVGERGGMRAEKGQLGLGLPSRSSRIWPSDGVVELVVCGSPKRARGTQ